jgi:hypothetical protein
MQKDISFQINEAQTLQKYLYFLAGRFYMESQVILRLSYQLSERLTTMPTYFEEGGAHSN